MIQANLFYSDNPNGPWTEVSMSDTGDGENWTGEIPAAAEGSDVYYYISGNAESGKTGSRPMPAPEGWWTFHVGEIIISGIDNFSATQIGAFANPYPNPASALTCIPVHLKQDALVKVTLIDALGRTIVVIHDGMLYAGETKLFFQASGITAGAYVISLENNEARLATSRIMIQ
jgi:hypothetical protein